MRVGDVVRLKCGGPPLVVRTVHDGASAVNAWVTVGWIDAEGAHRELFPVEALEYVPAVRSDHERGCMAPRAHLGPCTVGPMPVGSVASRSARWKPSTTRVSSNAKGSHAVGCVLDAGHAGDCHVPVIVRMAT